ncbi:MAG TPA: VIT1/CCC1 family protein [Steroidobacteraceae bacterium]|nr:VIT1/CCC1 family protein [Steroidobacteraceae bacterium]
MTPDPAEVGRLRKNLEDEREGAELYTALAAAERDPVRKDLFLQLAQAESSHAEVWQAKLKAAGIDESKYRPSFRTRLLSRLARRFGPGFVLPTVAAAEASDQNKYSGQPDAQSLVAEERGHAAVLAAATSPSLSIGAEIGRSEPWHRGASGNNLRAAVLGANDGLVSNFCLLMGIAGAGSTPHAILVAGFAGLIAGACSMGLGEWLSVANARELAASQIGREREELEQTPESERNELTLILQAKGLPKAEAADAAARIMQNKEVALDTLAREELGIDPAELGGNPWSAAGTSFLLFSAGAIVPVIPLLFARGALAILGSALASAVALGVIGLLTSLFNGRSPGFSALRQVAFGIVAAAITYGTGHLLGVGLA